MTSIPKGQTPPSDAEYSHIQFQIPAELHWELRQELFARGLAVRDVGEHMIRLYIRMMKRPEYKKPTTTRIRRKRKVIPYRMPPNPNDRNVVGLPEEEAIEISQVG